MAARGLFVTLEGGEGVGKSTLAKELAARAEAAGRSVVVTREPGGTPLAERIRELVLFPPDGTELSGLSEALLVNAARADHLDHVVRPALTRGEWVICDRFSDSTRVYQKLSGGVSTAQLRALEEIVVAEDQPDVTLVLDAPPESVLGRRASRQDHEDSFEGRNLAFHEAVRAAFLEIAEAEPGRCHVIDARMPSEKVADACWAIAEAAASNLEGASL